MDERHGRLQNVWRKAWQQLHKNVANNTEQVLEATPHKQQLYSNLPLITKTIKVRQTRHAGHCWGSKDELINDILLLTPSHGRAKVGWPARTYIQQLCADTGCRLEDLPWEMDDRDGWRDVPKPLYGYLGNVHRLSITHLDNMYTYRTEESRNSKTRNDFFVQVRNLFITYELKVST